MAGSRILKMEDVNSSESVSTLDRVQVTGLSQASENKYHLIQSWDR